MNVLERGFGKYFGFDGLAVARKAQTDQRRESVRIAKRVRSAFRILGVFSQASTGVGIPRAAAPLPLRRCQVLAEELGRVRSTNCTETIEFGENECLDS